MLEAIAVVSLLTGVLGFLGVGMYVGFEAWRHHKYNFARYGPRAWGNWPEDQ